MESHGAAAAVAAEPGVAQQGIVGGASAGAGAGAGAGASAAATSAADAKLGVGGQIVDNNNYELSDREDSSDSESDDESTHGKRVPEWARAPQLEAALRAQYGSAPIDPDSIFPEVTTVDLSKVFQVPSRSRRMGYRTSSGNWQWDRVTQREKLEYRNAMNFR